MDINKFALFADVAFTKNFTKSGERMGYTQPGVSHVLKTMEDEFGFPLFLRTRKGVTMTPNAEAILPIIREIVSLNEKLEQTINNINGLETGHLTIAAFASISRRWIPSFIYAFKKVNVTQHAVGLCDDCRTEFVSVYQLKALSCEHQLFLAGLVWVAHRTCAYHYPFALAFKYIFEQLRRIEFDLDILKLMLDMVAPAPAVTVDAAVRTATVDVHSVPACQQRFCIYIVHLSNLFAACYSHFFFLKKIRLNMTMTMLTIITIGYAAFFSSSGIYLKFMPYQPTISVSGMNIEVMTVSSVIMRFCFLSSCD